MPLYQHDECNACHYLGTYQWSRPENLPDDKTDYDLYYCSGADLATVVCRYGNDGPEYLSGMVFARQGIQPFAEAKRRAIEVGLMEAS